jgi:hypothetical protein
MESLQMEVEDFKSAVKLQSVAMDKFHQTRSEEVHKLHNLCITFIINLKIFKGGFFWFFMYTIQSPLF